MTDLIDPTEPLERQNEKLVAITAALMRRVESQTNRAEAAYAQFERAVVLEDQVRRRTDELETALRLLNESNARMSQAVKEAESARRDLAGAIEAVREGFALFGADDVLLLYNERFCWQLPDVRRDLATGMTFRDYVGIVSRSRYLALDGREARDQWARDRMRQHRDKHLFFNLALRGDHWLQVSEQRTSNAGTAIVQTDVTDLIRTERMERAKLLDSQAVMIRATLDHLNQGVAIFDVNRQLVGWNQRLGTLTRLPASICQLGTSFSSLAVHLGHPFAMRSREEELRLNRWVHGDIPGEPLSFEIARGSEIVLDVFMQRLPEGGFVISFSDVTREREVTRTLARAKETLERRVQERTLELQDAMQAAQRSNAAKTRFLAAASHDLLQPLSAAKLYLAGASAGGADEGKTQLAIGRAEEALTSVEEIIGALLDISRLDTAERAFDLQPIRLDPVLRSLATAFAPVASRKGLELRVMRSSAVVLSDPSYLRRIIQNLMSNALRYTERGGVLVGARCRGGQVRLEVVDTGPGIRDEDRAVIFEEFRRLRRRASASEGMGLGLAIVERACGRLGHGLDLVSVPGRGSCFRITLDRAEAPGAAGGDSAAARPVDASDLAGAGLIVLLVDNDHDLRAALVSLLEGWGVSVLEAPGAPEAVALLDELEIVPDALLIDQQLDAGDTGLALAGRMEARHGPLPTRLISADRSTAFHDACAQAGRTVLRKPLDTDELRSFLEDAAAARAQT